MRAGNPDARQQRERLEVANLTEEHIAWLLEKCFAAELAGATGAEELPPR